MWYTGNDNLVKYISYLSSIDLKFNTCLTTDILFLKNVFSAVNNISSM
jgi:hypothetical protein